jgi:microcin C transport system substrate-binding protein
MRFPATAPLFLGFALLIAPAAAQDMPAVPLGDVERVDLAPFVYKGHGIAMHGEPKYGPDFTHFDYLNPHAPKGGTLRLGAQGTFDSFNSFIAKGNSADGMGYLNESLMVHSGDEAFTMYGLIAESLEWPEDRSWVIFNLNPKARWHDGRPITADDVVFSLETLKAKGHPSYRFYYQSIDSAEKLGERRVRFNFAEKENRELPLIAGELRILPKHYWEGRDFEKTTLDPPLGSGPYRIGDFEPGRHVEFERVEDYWGADLPVIRGLYNFDRVRYDYFRDTSVIRQALKAGDIDMHTENQAKAWALEYDVPPVREGWLKTENIRNERPTGMQAFVMNTRRPIFQNRKLRRALAYAFDFEWSNRNLFFSQYARTESYFSNSELAAEGLPSGEELEILEPYRGRIPEEAFTREYEAPATDGTGWPRSNLETAFDLLAEAGWVVRDLSLVNEETGEPLRFEIMLVSPAFERIVLPFVRNLKRLGIDARVRLVDTAQYINRVRSFDFDMIVGGWGQSNSPGNEQRGYWGSAAANIEGSRNYIGVKDPVIDELIELIISAPDRKSLVTRTRALDRVLLWNHFVIPNWHIQVDRIASWDKFSRPEVTAKNGTSANFWWFDPVKAANLEKRLRSEPQTVETSDSEGTGRLVFYGGLGLLILFGFYSLRRLGGRPVS